MRNALRIFFVGGLTSYRALFNWVNPWVYVPQLLASSIFQILFFAYLGRFADVASDKFFLVGNSFIAIAITGFFGMGSAIGGERRSQTLVTLLASPANRFALFLGRAVPSILTGFVTAAVSFAICSYILGAHFTGQELAGLALAGLVASFSCTSFGLCLGSLGLRGRSVTLLADNISGAMLLTSGANVPLHRLPAVVRTISGGVPITHGIAAAHALGAGKPLADAGHLLLMEAVVGAAYLIVGLVLLRVLEYSGRRSAALEAF